jgi:hypothetical protein
MASERIFNIIIYFYAGVATEYGIYHHRVDGGEAGKTAFLVARVAEDHVVARRFPLSRKFTPEEWLAVPLRGDWQSGRVAPSRRRGNSIRWLLQAAIVQKNHCFVSSFSSD